MSYPTRVDQFDIGRWGKCRFGNWLHPQEGKKEFTERQIDWLAQFISPGDSCVDIGAYNGDTALPMAIASGANGEVVAYEPNPVTYQLLYDNSKLNPEFAPIKCRNAAIADNKGTEYFKYDSSGMNGGFPYVGLELGAKSVKVRTERLDTFKFKSRVAFVKIDTEGGDSGILFGYTPFLRHHRSVVQVERYPHLRGLGESVLWNAIVEYGTPFIEDDWDRTPLTSLPVGLCNIVITPHA